MSCQPNNQKHAGAGVNPRDLQGPKEESRRIPNLRERPRDQTLTHTMIRVEHTDFTVRHVLSPCGSDCIATVGRWTVMLRRVRSRHALSVVAQFISLPLVDGLSCVRSPIGMTCAMLQRICHGTEKKRRRGAQTPPSPTPHHFRCPRVRVKSPNPRGLLLDGIEGSPQNRDAQSQRVSNLSRRTMGETPIVPRLTDPCFGAEVLRRNFGESARQDLTGSFYHPPPSSRSAQSSH